MSASPKIQPLHYNAAARRRRQERERAQRVAREEARRTRQREVLAVARAQVRALAPATSLRDETVVAAAAAVAGLRASAAVVGAAPGAEVGTRFAIPARALNATVVAAPRAAAAPPAPEPVAPVAPVASLASLAAAEAAIEQAVRDGNLERVAAAVDAADVLTVKAAEREDADAERRVRLDDAADLLLEGLADRFRLTGRRYDERYGVLLAAVSDRFGPLHLVVAVGGEQAEARVLWDWDPTVRSCAGMVDVIADTAQRMAVHGVLADAPTTNVVELADGAAAARRLGAGA